MPTETHTQHIATPNNDTRFLRFFFFSVHWKLKTEKHPPDKWNYKFGSHTHLQYNETIWFENERQKLWSVSELTKSDTKNPQSLAFWCLQDMEINESISKYFFPLEISFLWYVHLYKYEIVLSNLIIDFLLYIFIVKQNAMFKITMLKIIFDSRTFHHYSYSVGIASFQSIHIFFS